MGDLCEEMLHRFFFIYLYCTCTFSIHPNRCIVITFSTSSLSFSSALPKKYIQKLNKISFNSYFQTFLITRVPSWVPPPPHTRDGFLGIGQVTSSSYPGSAPTGGGRKGGGEGGSLGMGVRSEQRAAQSLSGPSRGEPCVTPVL
jgi:hypothetical protein